MDMESLPTGMEMPSSGQSSIPIASTASLSGMLAAAKFIKDSATDIRAEAAAEMRASEGRSPIAIASPVLTPGRSEVAVTETSATGVCQGPTIWSRTTRPPTDLSAMVIRNDFEPTEGRERTRLTASPKTSLVETLGSLADHGETTSFTLANLLEQLQALRRDGHDRAETAVGVVDFSQLKLGTESSVVDNLGQSVGQTTSANIMNELNGVVGSERSASVDDFLGTSLDFSVASLYTGKVKFNVALARLNTGSRTTSKTNEHSGMLGTNGTNTTGKHNGLVVASDLGGVLVDGNFGGQALPIGASSMISRALAMWPGLPTSNSHGCSWPGMRRSDTVKPERPALGFEPCPTAPSSRISPPDPVAAPG
ncbi:phosphoribosylformylglycinamidine synthase-like protein, partial [Aureobasidium melanogenum]